VRVPLCIDAGKILKRGAADPRGATALHNMALSEQAAPNLVLVDAQVPFIQSQTPFFSTTQTRSQHHEHANLC